MKRRRISIYRGGKLVRPASGSRKRVRIVKGRTRASGYYNRYPPNGNELKFLDSIDAPITPAPTGTVQPSLTLITQGVGESQRIGRKTTLRKVFLRGVISLPSTALGSNTTDIVRIMIYQDKQANGANATPTDILAVGDQNGFMNLQNSQRFRVLWDKKFSINASAAAYTGTAWASGQYSRAFKASVSCNIPLEYSGTTGAITELRSNNVGVLLFTESGFASVGYHSRIRFSDN